MGRRVVVNDGPGGALTRENSLGRLIQDEEKGLILLVDVIALWAMAERTSEFGFSPNKTAALGLNLLLLVNLGWSAVLYARFLAKRSSFARLERWQTAYLPAYAVWAWIVVVLFPILFGYR